MTSLVINQTSFVIHEQIHLSLKDRDVLIRALLNPPKPSKSLVAAAQRYKKLGSINVFYLMIKSCSASR